MHSKLVKGVGIVALSGLVALLGCRSHKMREMDDQPTYEERMQELAARRGHRVVHADPQNPTQPTYSPQDPPENGHNLDKLVADAIKKYKLEVEPISSEYKTYANAIRDTLDPIVKKLEGSNFQDLERRNQEEKEYLGCIFNDLSLSYKVNNNHNRAVELFTQALKFFKREDQEIVYLNRGFSLYKLGRLSDALQDYEAAFEINPNNPKTEKWMNGIRHELSMK